ncbi:hypothetical protein B0H12DRAFT_1326234 [Mycena haematopus]|nr:hypothetical protein B0H12DRAFT_1326234 [Mycena haematopus]
MKESVAVQTSSSSIRRRFHRLFVLTMLNALKADRALVAALTARISDLENSISALRLEQAQVQARLDSYKYPVLTLPNEIISEIFTRVLPPYPTRARLTGSLSPDSLTRVCRHWREIALSLPSLWRAVNLSFNRISLEQQAHISDLWLKRSRLCPLSIELDARRDGLVLLKALTSVAANRTRLEHLKLVLFPDDLSLIEGSMPLLRHLDLELQSDPDKYVVVKPFLFCNLPALRGVVLNYIAALWVILPWAQLTSLALKSVYMHECISILQQTSNLMHCELHLHLSEDDHDSIITLPRLESLVLTDLDFFPSIERLKCFIVPAIRRLRISEHFLGDEPIHSLTEFISKSGSKLQEVCITDKESSVPTESYRDALQSVSKLSFISEDDLESNSNSDSSHITNIDPGDQ